MPDEDIDNNWSHRLACCGIMSAVRRTFCLVVTFDLILTFILWAIYVKLKESPSLIDAIKKEIEECGDFRHSLFDTVLCAALRFLTLILAYAVVRIQNPSAIAFSTFVTCVYIIAKVFAFDFQAPNPINPMCYVLLVETFVIAWIETWFLDFKVLPEERFIRRQYERIAGGERAPLLGPNDDDGQFHTPEASSPARDFTSPNRSPGYMTPIPTKDGPRYITDASTAWRQARDLLTSDYGWKLESGHREPDITIHSQFIPRLGKVLRLEAIIGASPEVVFQETSVKCERSPEWNHAITDYKILQRINENTDIVYNVTAAAAKGAVSSRDFVTLRHWERNDNVMLSAGCPVQVACMPPVPYHVRGENRLVGWMYLPVPGRPDHCLLRSIVSTDIKGWIPQMLVDQALTGVLIDCTKFLRLHVARLKARHR